jgi:hypothetical protein
LRKTLATFERATFGTWVKIVEGLAGQVQVLLNGSSSERDHCLEMFQLHDRNVLDALFSPSCVSTLQEANKLRNSWRGHGGILGPEVALQRRLVMEGHLARVREGFGDVWERYRLLVPEANRFTGHSYIHSLEWTVGVRVPFKLAKIEMSEPLQVDRLYLVGEEERRALLLLPFVKILASPSTVRNACYFYNRKEEDKFRFVSYHFEPMPEVVESFSDTAQALKDLLSRPLESPCYALRSPVSCQTTMNGDEF